MAEPRRSDEELINPQPDETRETEHERIRSSNDRDQALEREGELSERSRGYDDAVRGVSIEREDEDVDPDSAESDVDRDDTNVD